MSALTAFPALDDIAVRPGAAPRASAPAKVIDINVAREQRDRVTDSEPEFWRGFGDRLREDELEASIRRHPVNFRAGFQADHGAHSGPVAHSVPAIRSVPESQRYAWRVPAYAKVLGWAAAFAVVVSGAVGLGSALRPVSYSGKTWTHTVASGESLWALAAAIDTPRALEDVVEDIRQLNGLSDATLFAGQELTLPAR